ncbi:TetR/AcrR family transcriptional regulator [Streptomyces sp. NPDC005318]|uniref:TetR/AcrR family transcriptional regulator n=1 Tax=Streptomyces sp. NPDC005318 TaxID=3157031 RepID=UPI0033BC6465
MVDAWVSRGAGTGEAVGAVLAEVEDRAQWRSRLLRAGRDLFAAYGYAHTTIEQLCAEAKVPARAFFQQFTSPEALLIALYDEVATRGLRASEAVLLSDGVDECAAEERFRRLFDAYVQAVTEDPRGARVAFVEVLGVSRAVDDHLAMWRTMWSEFLACEAERAAERGEVGDGDQRVAVMVMTHSVDELLAHHGRRPRQITPDRLTEELTQLSLTMLGPP